MEITVFAKKRLTKEGKNFISFLTQITNKRTGEIETLSVKFREECGQPKAEQCPMNIVFEKQDANISKNKYVKNETGEEFKSSTLWISKWSKGRKYVDTSLDDYE